MRIALSVFRFLASVKLAVICIASLAATLAYATFYESKHGSPATQEKIYQSPGFGILLAFLAINIFCAAAIRFPWKRRQTGFVVTHIGLLVLIAGSFVGLKLSDEGNVAIAEGDTADRFVRTQHPLIRVRQIDRKTGSSEGEYEMPFNGGAFDWPAGSFEVISDKTFPFKIAVKEYIANAGPKRIHVESKGGMPMVRIRPMTKPPGATEARDVFEEERGTWLEIPTEASRSMRTSQSAGPARFAFTYANDKRVIDDFLNPPKNPGENGVARIHYTDKNDKPRTFDIRVDDAKANDPVVLPDSDLTVTFVNSDSQEINDRAMVAALGESVFRLVTFNVRKGSGPNIAHRGYAYQPTFPPIIPPGGEGKPPEPLVTISYFRPLDLGGGGMGGTFGVVELMGDPDGNLYYRVFGRDSTPPKPGETPAPRPGVVKSSGPLKLGEKIVAFGGNPNMPMTLNFEVEKYLTSGVDKIVYEPIELPVGKKGEGLAAAFLEMTVDGETREFWVRRPANFDTWFNDVSFPSKDFQVAYDCDRKSLNFQIKLVDFEAKFAKGSPEPTAYESKVLLTDESKGIKDKPFTIYMNHPLEHRGYVFYQSSYVPERDPRTKQETGDFQSIFQVGLDAGRPLKYGGSALIVLGVFLQFYMRAGVFTDGGKREDHRAAERARKLLERKGKKDVPKVKPGRTKRPKNPDEAIL